MARAMDKTGPGNNGQKGGEALPRRRKGTQSTNEKQRDSGPAKGTADNAPTDSPSIGPTDKPPRQKRRPKAAGLQPAAQSGTRLASRSANRQAAPDAARAAALTLLASIRGGASLDTAAAALPRALVPADRARALRLAAQTLRHRSRADAVLAPLLARRPKPVIGDLLSLAVTEILGLGEAPHGVVNAAVGLAKRQGRTGAVSAGMVNAVLRRAVDAQAIWDAAPPPPMPDWLRGPITNAWGETVAQAIEAAHEAGAPLDLTMKPGRMPDIPGTTALPTGSLRLPSGSQVTALPGYAEGDWWVQDMAAALPVRLLAPQPGEHIADLCAAPGGKTLQLAAAGAQVTAVDLSPSRLGRVAENLARCGFSADLVAIDALAWRPPAEAPDAVLLDAPCSATGTIRRHPELPLIRDGSGLGDLIALQDALIDHSVALLRPGGRLVFATCSLLPAEGEERLAAALSRHPSLRVEPPDHAALGIEAGWITQQGGLRLRPDLWPELGGMDGFFMARLRKSGGVSQETT